MARVRCRHCRTVGTTKPDGLCAACRRVLSRPSLRDAIRSLTDEQVEEIRRLRFTEKLPWVKVKSEMKRHHGKGPEGWDWHWLMMDMAAWGSE